MNQSHEMENHEIEISLIAPMLNKEINLEAFFERLLPVLEQLHMTYEIICINDGSTDATPPKLLTYRNTYPAVKIIDFSRNFGKEMALIAGLHYARGRVAIPIDADLQDPRK
jgi:glycosyltransferase involved in cell wall biosynthesis